jgi:uncharacterized protein involved in exopolysaccharide biosynthesis
MGADQDMYVRALRARWWIIVIVVAAALAAAKLFVDRETRTYRATASATVVPAPELTESAELLRALETLERRTVMATFALLPGSREMRQAAAAALEVDADALLDYRISASVVPSTNVLRVEVEGPDAIRTSEVANAVARVTAVQAGQLYRLFALQPLDPAIPMPAPIHPNPKRSFVVAGILGLFLGFAVMLGMEALAPPGARVEKRVLERQAQLGSA